MKNLKKTLSFVLVLAMVLGMVSTAFAATSFTDADAITNEEAVAVLTAIDVIDGFTDGSFGATKTVNRGQATAFICRMLLGREKADKLVAIEAPFSDVAANNQFAGYIAYCVAQGIVDGYADGTFKPTATVTTIQFGKMILTALGYNSAKEGFTGDGWKTNVYNILVAEENDLLEAVTCGANAGLTREEAAQVCFNALSLKTLTYVKDSADTTITVGDTKIEFGATSGHYNTSSTTLAEKYGLVKSTYETTTYGRPVAYTWKLNSKAIYSSEAKAVYTSADTYKYNGTVYTEAGFTTTAVAFVSYLNGEEATAAGAQNIESYAKKSGTSWAFFFGPGVTNELYKVGENAYKLVSYAKVAVQADTKYNTTSKGAVVAGQLLTTEKFPAVDAETKADDWFIVTYDNGVIVSAEKAALVTGTYQGYVNNSSITVDGVKYTYAYDEKYATSSAYNNTTKTAIDNAIANGEFAYKDKITVVTDGSYAYTAFAYVAPAEEAQAAKYLFLEQIGEVTTTTQADKYSAAKYTTTYYAKGKLADLSDFVDYNLGTVDMAWDAGWYSYTEKDGVYTLTEAYTSKAATATTVAAIGANISVADGIKASTTTKFVVTTYDATKKANVTTTYTGYKAVPTLTAKDGEAFTIEVLFTKANSGVADVVFVDATEAKAAVVDTSIKTEETYLIGYSSTVTQSGTDAKVNWASYAYCFDLDGTKTTLKFNTGECKVPAAGTVIKNVVYDNGYITSYETMDATYSLGRGDVAASDADEWIEVIDANTVVLNGDDLVFADDCVVYLYSNGAQKVLAITDLKEAVEDNTWTYHWNSYATAKVYLIKDKSGVVTSMCLWGAYDNTFVAGTTAEILYICGNKGKYQNSVDAKGNAFVSSYYANKATAATTAYSAAKRITVRFAASADFPTTYGLYDVTYDANGYIATCVAHVQ